MGKNEGMVAIYSRKSRFTGKGESIGNQVELCREYVRNLFGESYAGRCVVFEDEGFSGGNLKRPDFQRMMADPGAGISGTEQIQSIPKAPQQRSTADGTPVLLLRQPDVSQAFPTENGKG